MFNPVLFPILTLVLMALGFWLSRQGYKQSHIESCLFFATLFFFISLYPHLGLSLMGLTLLIPNVFFILLYHYYRLDHTGYRAWHEVAKESCFIGLLLLAMANFSTELHHIMSWVLMNAGIAMMIVALLAVTNLLLWLYGANHRCIVILHRCFYFFALLSILLTLGVEWLLVIVALGILFARIPGLHERLQYSLLKQYGDHYGNLLLVLIMLRLLVVQPYQVPTGSLEPTVAPGDFILVNQFAYGLRLPITRHTLLPIGQPKRGDIAVFDHPNGHTLLVKRVVGLPGDHLVYRHKQLIINGKPVAQTNMRLDSKEEDLLRFTEELPGRSHDIQITPYPNPLGDIDLVIPAGHYYMMGDNRDYSGDSRVFGPVSERLLVGQAFYIWFNWSPKNGQIDLSRTGIKL